MPLEQRGAVGLVVERRVGVEPAQITGHLHGEGDRRGRARFGHAVQDARPPGVDAGGEIGRVAGRPRSARPDPARRPRDEGSGEGQRPHAAELEVRREHRTEWRSDGRDRDVAPRRRRGAGRRRAEVGRARLAQDHDRVRLHDPVLDEPHGRGRRAGPGAQGLHAELHGTGHDGTADLGGDRAERPGPIERRLGRADQRGDDEATEGPAPLLPAVGKVEREGAVASRGGRRQRGQVVSHGR